MRFNGIINLLWLGLLRLLERNRHKNAVLSWQRSNPGSRFRATVRLSLIYPAELTTKRKKPPRYNAATFSLGRMEKLLSLLGNPHKKIHTVHIAGTKGKGSTATMLAKMLEANGYKVGLYTSPHVVSLRERIAVNSQMISEQHMLALLNRAYAPVEKIAQEDPPSFFEFMTALAFMHFADAKVDIAVIETGLGGRLDSTNVITPE